MLLIAVHRWSDEHAEPLTLDAIRRVHLPVRGHRIVRQVYPAGACFPEFSQASLAYVLEGACRYRIGTEEATLHEGDVAQLATGLYDVEVVGDREVVVVRVWEVPFDKDTKAN